jgi:hypothetical protein
MDTKGVTHCRMYSLDRTGMAASGGCYGDTMVQEVDRQVQALACYTSCATKRGIDRRRFPSRWAGIPVGQGRNRAVG